MTDPHYKRAMEAIKRAKKTQTKGETKGQAVFREMQSDSRAKRGRPTKKDPGKPSTGSR